MPVYLAVVVIAAVIGTSLFFARTGNMHNQRVKKETDDRDSQGDVYFADMGVSVVRPRCLKHIADGLLPQKWMGQKIYPLIQEAGCDVDYEFQIAQTEYWLQNNSKSGKTI